jgi:iron uptake system component EfeO
VDDFAGTDDPAFTGWHRLEYLLFEQGTTAGGGAFADRLDADLATLREQIAVVEFPPAAVALGPAELIEEVSEGKITGEEDRYAGTDLWDFDANVDGSRKLVELLTPALEARDPQLLADVEDGFAQVEEGVNAYALPGGGFRPYADLTDEDRQRLQVQLADLSEQLSLIPGVLELS